MKKKTLNIQDRRRDKNNYVKRSATQIRESDG